MSNEAFATNFRLYNERSEVGHWASLEGLQAPERRIIDILGERLARMDMLDVGVGGGRTAMHFAPLVRSYIGTDFAPAMVETCRTRFPQWRWAVADATDLTAFASRSFDFVLFSYNGLDYVSIEQRQTALNELVRVLRPGGYLVFSSHNLNFFPRLVTMRRFQLTMHPRHLVGNVRRFLNFRTANRHIRYTPELDTIAVYEGQFNFAAPTVYVRPRHQLDILTGMGLQEILLLPNESGKILAEGEIGTVLEPWVYYFCRAPQAG